MKIVELIKVNRPIINEDHDQFNRMVRDLEGAIESQANYPWDIKLENCHHYSSVPSFCSRVSFKEIYAMHFQSDEYAIMRVFLFDGKEVALLSKDGDTRYWSWIFLKEEYEKDLISFFLEIESELQEPIDESMVLNDNLNAHSTYLEFGLVNNEPYIVGFNGFSWALESYNTPKKAILKTDTTQVYDIVNWIQRGDHYDDNGNITILKDDKPVSVPLLDYCFALPHK